MPDFKPGQRWISVAELQMGLGTIMRVEQRTVSVMFLATGESRNYAVDTAPLTRVRYGPGDRVRSIDGWEMQVSQATELDGLLRYQGVRDDGSQAELPEGLLDCDVRLSRPRDRLLSGQLDHDRWFELRYRTLQQLNRLGHSDIRGLIGPRTSLLPHQLYIAREVAKRYAPRVLLADEVGLGKTIEAGLILHQQLLTERVRRILILVPETLLHQWLVEMLRRFNLRFSLFDEQRCADETDGGYDNPFEAEQLVICDLAFLSNDALRRQQALDSGWDLLVVDEAHHLAWSEDDPSTEYQLVEALAGQTGSVLLLTATPEQLGRAGHFGRLRLLDPQRFHDYRAFLAEEAAYAPVAELAARLLDGHPLDAAQKDQLKAWLEDVSGLAREDIIDRLIDRHGTGRVLFRNTRHAIKGFPRRSLHVYGLPLPTEYADVTAHPCPERAKGDAWTAIDPRVPWLYNFKLDFRFR